MWIETIYGYGTLINLNYIESICVDYMLSDEYKINAYTQTGKCFTICANLQNEESARIALENIKTNINTNEISRR